VSAAERVPAPAGVLALPPLAAGSDVVPGSTAGTAAAVTGTGATGADDRWARPFGAAEVGDGPRAVAVSGTTVYVGGSFTGVMAGMPQGTYNRIARWDGEAWHRMGEGVDSTVTALTVAGNDVFVGGEFSTAGGQVAAERLARWDGQAWSAIGSVQYAAQPYATAVRVLASEETHLYVGGVFDLVGEVPVNGLARMELATGRWEPSARA
jgi:trimeric autotransporter adhesin